MITHIIIVAVLATIFIYLMRYQLIQVELISPWFAAIVLMGFLSLNPSFVNWLGRQLNIVYAPVAVVFVVIFLLLISLIFLSVGLTRIRERQLKIIRHLAAVELDAEERRLNG